MDKVKYMDLCFAPESFEQEALYDGANQLTV